MEKIPFNKPCVTGNEQQFFKQVLKKNKFSGDGFFTKKCHQWFENSLECNKALLTTSGTHALEMAAILIDTQPGDEIIMSSFTFVSTANAFILRGAKIVFIDICPDTMNMDELLIDAAITSKTKAIVPVHYGGVACKMDKIMEIATRHKLWVIEDAAQGLMAKYKSKYLGTIGHLGCFSFHETKNYHCGEGGALIINDKQIEKRAEIIREKGTNRSQFWRGEVDKYTWVDIGSSYLPSELNAAFLYAQLEKAELINQKRLAIWDFYYKNLSELQDDGFIKMALIPNNSEHNGHLFYILVKNIDEREQLIHYLKTRGIYAVFHYIPLHLSPQGVKCSVFIGEDKYTSRLSERLLRLPMWFGMRKKELNKVVKAIKEFYKMFF